MANIFEKELDRNSKIITVQTKKDNENEITQILNENKSFVKLYNQSLIGPIKVNSNPNTNYRIFV